MAQAELDAATYNLESKLEAEQNDFQTLLNTFSEGIESQQDLDFLTNDNDVDFKKEKVSYEIYKSPNYQILADPKLTYQKANQIVKSWIVSYDKRNELCQMIRENFKSLHYIYSTLYPKIYSKINQFGIKNKSEFELAFTRFKVQKQSLDNFKQTDIKTFFAGKNPDVYKKREEVHVNEQKPEKTDEKKWFLSEKKHTKTANCSRKSKRTSN